MGRLVHNYDPRPVAESEIAPHRYTWDGKNDEEDESYNDWKKSVPYKIGDVVYLDLGTGTAVKARVINFFPERNRFGDRITKYRVQTETKTGMWSKNWIYTWPRFIQRGYKLAGLAPDVLD